MVDIKENRVRGQVVLKEIPKFIYNCINISINKQVTWENDKITKTIKSCNYDME